MKLKKITLYYRGMKEFQNTNPEEIGKIVVFKTKEGGFGIRQQRHGWQEGDTVWTADGRQPSTVIAVAQPEAIDALLEIFLTATYIVNRFATVWERQEFLDKMESELLKAAA